MGHPEAFVRRARGTLERLGAGGAPAGIVDDETYPEDRVTLGPGDAVLLFTDGLSEANDGAADFGEDGIAGVLAAEGGQPAAIVTEALFTAVYDHLKGRSVNDDITVLLACRVTAPPPARAAA
jgi:sigma-B regulation protein RsbU (phosphoserine phosphatase)